MRNFLCLCLLVPGLAAAQPDPDSEGGELVPLRVELFITRHRGAPNGPEISRLAHTLQVVANSRSVTSLREGREVPVMVTQTIGASDDDTRRAVPVTSYQYRNVGTNVTCRARSHGNGFRVNLNFEQSSIHANEGSPNPSFRTFSVSNELWLEPGRSQDLVLVSDPSSDEVVTIQITLSPMD